MSRIQHGIRKIFTVLCLMVWLLPPAVAQTNTGTIQGVIHDDAGLPAEGVNVLIENTQRGAVTDAKGFYEIKNVPAGAYWLTISRVGLAKKRLSVEVKGDQTTRVPDVSLSETQEELDEITVTGEVNHFAERESNYTARLPIKNLENPQVYNVITDDLLKEQVVVDIESSLSNAVGVSNIAQAPGGGGTSVGFMIRGFNTQYTAIRNGMNVSRMSLTDPVNVERMEVLKGPSGTLFGSSLISYGGLVNFVTKMPQQDAFGEISYTTGSWDLSRFTADLNTPLNADKTALVRVNAAIHNQGSYHENHQSTQENMMIAPTFVYKPTDRLTIRMDLEHYTSNRNNTYYSIRSGTVTNFADYHVDPRVNYNDNEIWKSKHSVLNTYARIDYKLSDTWTSQTNYSNSKNENTGKYLFVYLTSDTTLSRALMRMPSTMTAVQVQQNFVGDFHIGAVHNRMLVGGDYYKFDVDSYRYPTVSYDAMLISEKDPAMISRGVVDTLMEQGTYVVRQFTEKYGSGYLSDVVSLLNDRLVGMASIRFDHFDYGTYTQNAWSPKFGAIYQVVKDEVSLFANYMNGFSNVAPVTDAVTNEQVNFKPEHADQLEGGVKVNLLEGRLSGSVSYYDIKVSNKTRTRVHPDDATQTQTVQDATQFSRGFELDIIANPLPGLNIVAGYSDNHSEYGNENESIGGNRPAYVPNQTANLWASYKLTEGKMQGLGIGFGGNYSGDVFTSDANTITMDGYTVLNASIFYNTPKYGLSVKVNNLADKEYWVYNIYAAPQNPRQVMANVRYRF